MGIVVFRSTTPCHLTITATDLEKPRSPIETWSGEEFHVRVGMEHSRWFERLLGELGFEVWIGDPAEIKRRRVKRQETDRKDAQLLLKLLMEDRFPRIWVPSPEIAICVNCFGTVIGWYRCERR
jgi:transposase